jgi:hypothetical protein
MKIKMAISILVTAAIPAFGDTIANWTFDSDSPTATSVDPNATASSFTLSSGSVTYYKGNPSTGQAIGGKGWNVSDGNMWWEFTVTADAGDVLNFKSLTFDDRASGTGPTDWSVTINGDPAGSSQSTHGSFSTDTADLSAAEFQGLTSAEVKIFGFGATSSKGTWRLDNVSLNRKTRPVPVSLPVGFGAGALLTVLALSRCFTGAEQSESR